MDTKAFVQAYIEAALWSTTDESREDGGDPLDENYGPEDLVPETLLQMENDCKQFISDNQKLLKKSGLSAEQAGHDFWLTRNGHGTGYWDRDLPGDIGDKLTEACKVWGSVDLYVGDDGKIYC